MTAHFFSNIYTLDLSSNLLIHINLNLVSESIICCFIPSTTNCINENTYKMCFGLFYTLYSRVGGYISTITSVITMVFRACLGDLPSCMPRRSEIRFFCSKAAPLSSGQIVPNLTIAEGNSILPTCETKCQTRYCQSFHGYHGPHQCLH